MTKIEISSCRFKNIFKVGEIGGGCLYLKLSLSYPENSISISNSNFTRCSNILSIENIILDSNKNTYKLSSNKRKSNDDKDKYIISISNSSFKTHYG
jgi:hypothetical protein